VVPPGREGWETDRYQVLHSESRKILRLCPGDCKVKYKLTAEADGGTTLNKVVILGGQKRNVQKLLTCIKHSEKRESLGEERKKKDAYGGG